MAGDVATCTVCHAELAWSGGAAPEALCRACADARGVVRLVDVRDRASFFGVDRSVDEGMAKTWATPNAMPTPEEFDALIASMITDDCKLVRVDEECRRRVEQAQMLRDIGPLTDGDVVVLQIEGYSRISPESVDLLIDHLDHLRPDDDSPIIVLPLGSIGRIRQLAREAGCDVLLPLFHEAPPVVMLDLDIERDCADPDRPMERAWRRWFDRDDISDDELTEILAEQEAASWDEIREVLDERAKRRELRGVDGLVIVNEAADFAPPPGET